MFEAVFVIIAMLDVGIYKIHFVRNDNILNFAIKIICFYATFFVQKYWTEVYF